MDDPELGLARHVGAGHFRIPAVEFDRNLVADRACTGAAASGRRSRVCGAAYHAVQFIIYQFTHVRHLCQLKMLILRAGGNGPTGRLCGGLLIALRAHIPARFTLLLELLLPRFLFLLGFAGGSAGGALQHLVLQFDHGKAPFSVKGFSLLMSIIVPDRPLCQHFRLFGSDEMGDHLPAGAVGHSGQWLFVQSLSSLIGQASFRFLSLYTFFRGKRAKTFVFCSFSDRPAPGFQLAFCVPKVLMLLHPR